MYSPRPSDEITRDLIARFVARTNLTDISEGSVILAIMQTFAEQIAESEIRLAQIREQFTLTGASGTDLDERVEELSMTRLPATRATGSLRVTRTDTTNALTIEAGAVFGSTSSDVTYISTTDTTLSIGQGVADLAVQASVVGEQGNIASAKINQLLDVPSLIVSVSQGVALSNGTDAEDDVNLRARAQRHLNSLARCQPLALTSLALSFTSSDNTRATTATLYELPDRFGECELLIDDGSGLGDTVVTRSGSAVSVVLNAVRGHVIGIEAPVASNPTILNGSVPLLLGTDYLISYERGLIHLLENANVAEGDTITISNYSVYTGLVAELQSAIEGDVNDVTSGYRPAGVSVRVLPAPVQRIDLDLLIVISTGANLTTVSSNVGSAVSAYLSRLDAGAPAIIASIVRVVMSENSVLNVNVLSSGTTDASPDVYPTTPRTILRAGSIRVVTSTTTG